MRRSSERQRVLPFIERMIRRDAQFRRLILAATAVVVLGIVLASADLRYWVSVGAMKLQQLALIGVPVDKAVTRPVSDEEWTLRRERKVRKGTDALENFLSNSKPEVQALFKAAGMAPPEAIHRWGRGDQVFMFSSQVFEEDKQGRSYRLKPNIRSVWLRELVMKGGPHGLLLVPDRPDVRALAPPARGIVVEDSVQTTNSWGLRGPEPDLAAKIRVLVLGDSYMQGMFIGDAVAPPFLLQEALAEGWGCSVSVLNTGHVGYSPEQYYYSYREYVDRFQPHILVLSVCHNDFGDDGDVIGGKGNLYDEAGYWINRILEDCRGKNLAFLLVPVPHRENVVFFRSNGHYPGHILEYVPLSPKSMMLLTDDFINENLRLWNAREAKQPEPDGYELYNTAIGDGHFSAAGSRVWARGVATRVSRLIDPAKPPRTFYKKPLGTIAVK